MYIPISKKNNTKPEFTLQFHLTAKCLQQCKHCYMYDSSTYLSEINNELSLERCLEIIDDFTATMKRWKLSGRIFFTGGDPLLRNDIYDIVKYAYKKGNRVGILGNPNFLTYDLAKSLKHCGVSSYQISIDGLKKTHDFLRGKKGMFRSAVNAIHTLNDSGIKSVVLFTLSKLNAPELIDVIYLMAKKRVSVFDFARLVPIGHGKEMKNMMLTPTEYRNLLSSIEREYEKLEAKSCKTYFGRKESLWALLYWELGKFSIPRNTSEIICGGCSAGCNSLTVLADGTVLPCRRLPVSIGKVPKQKIRDIFINSRVLNRLRAIEKMQKCGSCELRYFCRGCPAVAYALHGDYMASDPQCWKGCESKMKKTNLSA